MIFRTGEDFSKPGLGRPVAPPSRFLERLISARLGRSHSEGGTEPVKELLERSIVRSTVMFLRNFHEIVPVRFLDERCISEIGGVEQLGWDLLRNQEMLKPVTEANALARRARSELLQLFELFDDDSARKRSEMRRVNLKWVFMV